MREIKFRAWDNEKREFLSGDYEPISVGDSKVVTGGDWQGLYLTDKYVIEQYTGLKDRNGKEIYEGDIVSEEFEYAGEKTKTIWQVRWCDDECAFELRYVSGFEVEDCSLVADDEENYEVIGNIHENPELLERRKNETAR